MKLTTTLILIISLVALPMHGADGSKKKDGPAPESSLGLAILVLTAAAVAAYVVIKVHSKHKQLQGPVTLVLEKSGDNVHWTPVSTNRVVLNGEEPIEFFREVRKDGHSFYRAIVVQ